MIGELTNHLWQSTLFAVAAGLLTCGLPREQGPGAPLAVVQRVDEIPAAVCPPDEPWQPSGADPVDTRR